VKKKRKRIAVGCIVNLRKDLGLGADPAFGSFSWIILRDAPMP